MDIKENISSYINKLLLDKKWTQKELADLLGIKQGRLSAYVTGKELPRVDILMRLAEVGGTTLDDLLKTSGTRNGDTQAAGIAVNVNGNSNVSNVVTGSVYVNTTVKNSYKYVPQPGDLTDAQASRLQDLVNEIVELEQTVKAKPRGHAAVWGALKRRYKVTYYRSIKEESFPDAEAYLMQWCGRLKRPLKRKDNDSWRTERYKAIFSAARNQLKWTKDQVDDFIRMEFSKDSIRDLTDKELESLYLRIMRRKNR